MSVRAHVHRHPIDGDREIGAMIEIEAAQEVLVGFALATVLCHHEAGDGLQNLACPIEGTGVQALFRNDTLAAGLCRTHESRSRIRGQRCRFRGSIGGGHIHGLGSVVWSRL
jgi:hypothetical protein